jgi:hypothetical protein
MEYDYLLDKYGPVMTLLNLADTLHRSYDGLRGSLKTRSTFYDAINAARVPMGRKIYFLTAKIIKIIGGEVD